MSPGYLALREAAAWIDHSGRGRFRARGQDAARLLHAMCTNHVLELQPGNSCYAFFLNAQGRILADAHLLALNDHFLIDTEPETHELLWQHLDKHIIADDVTLEDARQDTDALGLEGPRSAELIAAIPAEIVRAPFSATGAQGYRLFFTPAQRAQLIALLEQAGARPATPQEVKVVRLEHFHPRYGDDINDRCLVHETQLLHAVHFNKGCYLGQEIVERVRARGQVHRLLAPLWIQAETPPEPRTTVLAGDQAVGETMSAAFSPALGKVIAFAYVRAEHARPGARLRVGEAEAEVAAAKGR